MSIGFGKYFTGDLLAIEKRLKDSKKCLWCDQNMEVTFCKDLGFVELDTCLHILVSTEGEKTEL